MEDTAIDAGRAVADRPPVDAKPGQDVPDLDRRKLASRGLLREVVARVRRNAIRELWDWGRAKRVKRTSLDDLVKVISALTVPNDFSTDTDRETPIFLLATGWRSGSTLLQRILVSDPNVLLWGEPLGEMALLSSVAEMLSGLSTLPNLEQHGAGIMPPPSSLPTSWIATLYPPGSSLRAGLRKLFDGWLAEPARQGGWKRWGLKEVRLGAAEAVLLHWLYPKAKFVLLSRNPYDCYRSLSDSGWHHVYYNRPAIRVDSAAGLARHWSRIATSWARLPSGFPAFRIKYEDLIAGKVNFRELESWLGVKLNEDLALSARVGSTARRHRLGWCEHLIISREAGAGIRALGY